MAGKTTNLRAALVNGMAFVSLADLDTWADNWLAQCVVQQGDSYVIVPKQPRLASVLVEFKEQLLDVAEEIEKLAAPKDEGDGDIGVEVEA